MIFSSEGCRLKGSYVFRDSVFICLLLPENVIICDKRSSKCGKWAIFNDLKILLNFAFYYILR